METKSRTYRLERWLAFLLSLLFLLPFVAEADDIVRTDVFHAEELAHADGEEFLALTRNGMLVPVKIAVAPERGMGDETGEQTAKRVSVAGFEDVFLVRGARLHPGPVSVAAPDFIDDIPRRGTTLIRFGGVEHSLWYRCSEKECTLVLSNGDVSQDLATIDAMVVGDIVDTFDVHHVVHFAGDLDHDGRLDLIVDVATHWNEARPALFLSTSAAAGALVGKTAELSTTGC